jgi:hypothetical protein
MSRPLYSKGERVTVRTKLFGTWQTHVLAVALASEMPTLDTSQGWCYEVAIPRRATGLNVGTVWLYEESLYGWDELGFP